MKVLLVDDDTNLLDVTAYALRREGFTVATATDGPEALQLCEADPPHVVVLDVGLPRLDGYEVCRRIKEGAGTPVILLTGLADEGHILQGFRLGADDYVTKPFSARQLAMRIRAVARRGTNAVEEEQGQELRVADLVLDVESHEARWGDRTARLTPTEFRLLYLLASNAGRVVRAARLVDGAWPDDRGDPSLLKTHISHIRSKLRLPPSGPGSITAAHGVGYRLNTDSQHLLHRSSTFSQPNLNHTGVDWVGRPLLAPTGAGASAGPAGPDEKRPPR